eukprot:GAFH01001092.1.p1 GENE.GAFH01001092.1~~GAFH01001092.1.p1  ORF type:complete len:537 (+),score=216.37 GAFH01001092.1:196-1611(+)
MIGLGGNNGTTVTAQILANREHVRWETKDGPMEANFLGSLLQCSTSSLGFCGEEEVFVPFKSLVPLVDPTQIVVGGWDINNMNLADAMRRAKVLDINLQQQVAPMMRHMVPLPSVYIPDFIASEQSERANNTLPATLSRWEAVEHLRADIRNFKTANHLDKIVVLWTASTERFCQETVGVHDSADNLLAAIHASHAEISPSTLFAVASILEGCAFVNGSPQNTLVPGVVDLATRHHVPIAGSDFKTGQTKLKSVLVDFLISSGIRPLSVVSYNHLGNNDGANLANPRCFRSKEISKSSVCDDMIAGNQVLFPEGKKDGPDHLVIIKYCPAVGDSKRAMDEYYSEIAMGGKNTISIHNVCEDSLLAAPVIIDLACTIELFTRIEVAAAGAPGSALEYQPFHPLMGSFLGFLLKAPLVAPGVPLVNSLFKQRLCLENLLRVLRGLEPNTLMNLERNVEAARHPAVPTFAAIHH